MQYFSPTLDQTCFPGTKIHLYWFAGHLLMTVITMEERQHSSTLCSTNRSLRFKKLIVLRAPFLAEYIEMQLNCRCVLTGTKKYLSDQFLLTPDDDLNYFLAKSTIICRREFTKIGVHKVGSQQHQQNSSSFWSSWMSIHIHWHFRYTGLQHHPPIIPFNWPLAVQNACIATQMWM